MLDLKYKRPAYMDIMPNNSCIVCRGVTFTPDHTILFASSADQYVSISAKQKTNAVALSPISLSAPVRYPAVADSLYDCNYIIFRNENFSDKIWYAFITSVDYVNPNTCLINFSIDYMQTFMFDMNLGMCFVEREHVNDDTIGKHILDEGLALTEYICSDEERTNMFSNTGIRVSVASKQSSGIIDRVYSGILQRIFTTDEIGVMEDLLDTYVESPDNVVAIQMVPYDFYNSNGNSQRKTYTYKGYAANIDGYVPHNNKLFVYPYNFLYVDNGQGQAKIYRFENWPNNPTFTIHCAVRSGNSINAVCTPSGKYEGWDLGADIADTLTLSGFPMCAWASDTFRAYLAQNSNSYRAALGNIAVSAVTNAVMGASTAGPAGAVGGAAIGAAGAWASSEINRHATLQNARLMPDKIHGNEGANTSWSYNSMDFYFCRRCIKSDIAKTIDGYFDRFGYKINKLKQPNINSRLSWNYIKTNNAIVNGNIPQAAKQAIAQALDHGITFWHGDYIGNYNRSNVIRSVKDGETQNTATEI